jgi:hypothetical protein
MSNNLTRILKQIDDLIMQHGDLRARSQYNDLSDLSDSIKTETNTRLMAGVRRYAPKGSAHRDSAEELLKRFGVDNGYLIEQLLGILRALRADYAAGYMQTIEELIHATLLSDCLDMQSTCLSTGIRIPRQSW